MLPYALFTLILEKPLLANLTRLHGLSDETLMRVGSWNIAGDIRSALCRICVESGQVCFKDLRSLEDCHRVVSFNTGDGVQGGRVERTHQKWFSVFFVPEEDLRFAQEEERVPQFWFATFYPKEDSESVPHVMLKTVISMIENGSVGHAGASRVCGPSKLLQSDVRRCRVVAVTVMSSGSETTIPVELSAGVSVHQIADEFAVRNETVPPIEVSDRNKTTIYIDLSFFSVDSPEALSALNALVDSPDV